MKQESKNTPQIKILTESEIQEKLYGKYFRKQNTEYTSTGDAGVDILSDQLKRLQEELVQLRQEKRELKPSPQTSPPAKRSHLASDPVVSSPSRIGRWVGFTITAGIIFAGMAYPLGFRFLQASPVAPESSPYTVQIAVYNGQESAYRAVGSLQKIGYNAFFVASSYANGRPKYSVYIGQFVTKQEAELERKRLVSDSRFSDAFVRVQ